MQTEREELVGRERVALMYWEVQLDLTPEIEVFHILFERCHTKNRERSIEQHIKYSISGVKFSWTTLYRVLLLTFC